MALPLVAAIQMNSGPDIDQNLVNAGKYIEKAAQAGAKLIVLPEMFICLGESLGGWMQYAEDIKQGPIQAFLSTQARKHGVWLVGGTIPIKSSDPQKAYASCLVYDDSGQNIARYDKMHLFDVTVTPGTEIYQESAFTVAGNAPTIVETPWGRMGIAVCFDLRFTGLFEHYADAECDFIVIPSAFTLKTGIAHWEVLLRARALDTFSYIIAANQTGEHPGDRHTFGHSMIISPWGNILAAKRRETGIITAEIDRQEVKNIRKRFGR